MGKFSTKQMTATLLVSTLILSGCGSSRLNPLNWFGRSRSEIVVQSTNPLIPTRSGFRRGEASYAGTPVDQITGLVIERAPGGAIIRVNGQAATQGSYDVLLVAENEDELPVKGVLSYTLKARLPAQYRAQGAATSREISAAHFVTDQQLDSVRTIRVVGARNAHTVRRR